jgi:hypothetical protein
MNACFVLPVMVPVKYCVLHRIYEEGLHFSFRELFNHELNFQLLEEKQWKQ